MRNPDLLMFQMPTDHHPHDMVTRKRISIQEQFTGWMARDYVGANIVNDELPWYHGDTYVLKAAVYFNGNHFISVVRMKDVLYQYDGMDSQGFPKGRGDCPRRPFAYATLLEGRKGPRKDFPLGINGYWLDFLMFVRKEV